MRRCLVALGNCTRLFQCGDQRRPLHLFRGFLKQPHLAIDQSHKSNNRKADGSGENHFVEHLFLLVSDLVLGQKLSVSNSVYKVKWGENRTLKAECV